MNEHMKLDDYCAHMNAYFMVFLHLAICREVMDRGQWQSTTAKADFKKDAITQIRSILSNPKAHHCERIKCHKTVRLGDLIGDIEIPLEDLPALTDTIDNVKKLLAISQNIVKPVTTVPAMFAATDYYRDNKGRVVYPFYHWKEIVEIFMLSCFNKKTSNAQIAKDYTFTVLAKSSGNGKSKQQVVKKALAEANRLIDAAVSASFPPLASSLWLPAKNKE